MSKKKIIKKDILMFLAGRRKAELLRYCLKKKKFYQAEAAFDLHWHISTTQYYLENFVKHGLLIRTPTSYKTYYQFLPHTFTNMLSLQT